MAVRAADQATIWPNLKLVPLIDALCARDRPGTTEVWAHSKRVRPLLQGIARGDLALTHDAFTAVGPSHAVDHLRDLLMTVGLLRVRDRHILRVEQWSGQLLASIDNAADRRVIATYIWWHQHRRLEAMANAGGVSPSSPGIARQQTRAAVAFLDRLRAGGVSQST